MRLFEDGRVALAVELHAAHDAVAEVIRTADLLREIPDATPAIRAGLERDLFAAVDRCKGIPDPDDDELPPCVGERFRDVIAERRAE